MLATALCPVAAAQIVLIVRPRPVAAPMIGIEAPTAVAGTYPTSTRASATLPATKTGTPTAAGFPARNGFGTGSGAGLGCVAPVSNCLGSNVLDSVVITTP